MKTGGMCKKLISLTDFFLIPAIAKEFCLGGEALMFPSTNTPVVCNRYNRCPSGYYCRRNRKSMQHYCCSKAEQLSMETYISQVGMSLRNAVGFSHSRGLILILQRFQIKEIAKKKTELAQQFATFRMPPRRKKRPEKKQELIKPVSVFHFLTFKSNFISLDLQNFALSFLSLSIRNRS